MVARPPRAPRRENWEIEEIAPGRWEVRQGRKRKSTESTERDALEFIRPRHEEGQKVVVIEASDGYRLDVTRRFRKTR